MHICEWQTLQTDCTVGHYGLILKAPITTAADDSLEYFLIGFFFSDKIMLDISCESSAWQRIHMKYQALFCSKDKSNKSVVCCNFA